MERRPWSPAGHPASAWRRHSGLRPKAHTSSSPADASSGVDDAVASIGAGVTGVQGDITDADDLERLAGAIREHGKGLDVVFANAGGGEFATLADETPEHLLDTLNRNVGGTVFTVQKVLPLLNEGASIVLAGSTAAYGGVPAFGAYAASKAAIRSLGRTWAAELVAARSGSTPWSRDRWRHPGCGSWRRAGRNRRCSTVRPPRCRWAASAGLTRSPRPWCFSPRIRAAS